MFLRIAGARSAEQSGIRGVKKVRSLTIDNVPMPGLSVSYDAGEPGICIAWRKYLQKLFCT